MSKEPWGPQDEGEWVKIAVGSTSELDFPAWVKMPAGNTLFVTKTGDSITLQSQDGDTWNRHSAYLSGDYVWIPAPADEPKPKPKPDLPEKTLLQAAEEIINGERAKDYGSAKENLERIAVRWSQVVGVPVSIEQVGMMMIDLKLSRLIHTPTHYDSLMDIAGYAGVVDKAWRGE